MEWPDWPEAPPEKWPTVLATRAPDVTVDEGAGLGGPLSEERTNAGPGLSSCGDWGTPCPCDAPLLLGPWGGRPWAHPWREMGSLLETFAFASPLGNPGGCQELESWGEVYSVSLRMGDLKPPPQTVNIGYLCGLRPCTGFWRPCHPIGCLAAP